MSGHEISASAGQGTRIAVLLVEDNPDDAALCLRILKKSAVALECEVVKTRSEFVSRVSAMQYDIVLCDYNVSGWTALEALDHLQALRYETSFILVTGSLGDETAVECMRKGIADYILKDRLHRLPLAITRCLEMKAAREARERAMRESEEKCRLLLGTIPAAVFVESAHSCTYVNQAAADLTGYTGEQLLTMKFIDLLQEESRQFLAERAKKQTEHSETRSYRAELKLITKRRELRWLDVVMSGSPVGPAGDVLITGFDVTEKKRGEQESSASRDPLTGLPNYARMAEIFDTEAIRTDRTERPFAVVSLQLQGIKQMRAQYGSLVVQEALCRIARVMRLHSRALDSAFRLGEDEFAFILPETGAEGEPVMGGRIATRLAEGTEEPRLNVKFGIATYPRDGKTADQSLAAARSDLARRDAVKRGNPAAIPRK